MTEQAFWLQGIKSPQSVKKPEKLLINLTFTNT